MVVLLTPMQSQCLAIINRINVSYWNSEFLNSEIMAFIDVESSFRPNVTHVDRPGLFSVGLMQIENTTARGYGVDDMNTLRDPETCIRVGMNVCHDNWLALKTHLQREPFYEEWAAAYNEGIGNVLRGREDDAYVNKWLQAQRFWAAVAGVD